MSHQLHSENLRNRPEAEFLLFLIASAVGIYSLGQGLRGLFEPGQGIDLLCTVCAKSLDGRLKLQQQKREAALRRLRQSAQADFVPLLLRLESPD